MLSPIWVPSRSTRYLAIPTLLVDAVQERSMLFPGTPLRVGAVGADCAADDRWKGLMPLGVPRPVGPSKPGSAAHRYETAQVPFEPDTMSLRSAASP